jgi:hypothetical protein
MRNANEAATGAGDISANIGGVARAADGTSVRAQESQKAAQEFAAIAAQLSSLMAQFRIERRDTRMIAALPVRVTLTGTGRPFEQEAMTVNISRQGSLLKGIHGNFKRGSRVSLSRLNKREPFLVVWIGEENTATAGQIGVSTVDPNSSFWDDVLREHSNSETTGAPGSDPEPVLSESRARAQGA